MCPMRTTGASVVSVPRQVKSRLYGGTISRVSVLCTRGKSASSWRWSARKGSRSGPESIQLMVGIRTARARRAAAALSCTALSRATAAAGMRSATRRDDVTYT